MNGNIEPPSVAIVGRPNVGKSALFNRLAGRRIAIVHDQPGITRDRVSAISARAARPFLVWDTGGILGAGESELTGQVRRAVEEAIRESNLLLFVVDGKDGLTPVDRELARLLRKSAKPVVLAINKIDNEKNEGLAADFDSLGFDHAVSISAEHNRGILELLEAVDELLGQGTAASQPPSIAQSAAGKPPLLEPPPLAVAVIGRPNVGKSSFINAIVQNQRAIVSELPGTTRDAVDIDYRRDDDRFVFIDTAGIRKRGRHSSSVEVFSVMRSERSIRRADVCVLIIDLTSGVTAQDKKIAGLIQEAGKAAIVVMNKFDLVKRIRASSNQIKEIVEETRARLFFLDYAPVLVTSALSGKDTGRIFQLIKRIRRAAQARIGTGVLNRLLRAAFAANPPPMAKGRRLKLFYAAQAQGGADRQQEGGTEATPNREQMAKPSRARRSSPLQPPEFVLFVNEPRLLGETYRRYLEARIRDAESYPGLPIRLTLRARTGSSGGPASRR